jgi:hypothetical protein
VGAIVSGQFEKRISLGRRQPFREKRIVTDLARGPKRCNPLPDAIDRGHSQ